MAATTHTASLPAPIGGWNARDSLAEMPETDAIFVENFWMLPTDLMVRKGWSEHSTGLPDQVESLMVYSSGTTEKMFAVSDGNIYDATMAGAIGAADVSGLNSSRWEYVNVSTPGGSFLLAVSGTDKLQGYDGSNWYEDGDGTHDISGVDTADCIQINLFKNRVWLIEEDSLTAWYLPINSIAGVAQPFSFQSVARAGGSLVAMATWTLDAGYGADDYAVFITSNGEVIVYRGTDPSSSATWALTGVWQIGAPFTRRCFLKFGGDVLLLTFDGLYPLASYLQSSRLDPRVALTDKIYTAISQATQTYSANFGWEMTYYAKANMLLINVPIQSGNMQQQFAMNTITKSWCNFSAINANCWAIFNDEPYFGSDEYVGQFWNTLSDNGQNIFCDAKQSFNYFKSRGQQKLFTMARPIILTNGTPSINFGINVDFDDTDIPGNISFSPTSYLIWDVGLWDVSLWGGGLSVNKTWVGINGLGYCAAPRLQLVTQGIETHWTSTDFVMRRGGII